MSFPEHWGSFERTVLALSSLITRLDCHLNFSSFIHSLFEFLKNLICGQHFMSETKQPLVGSHLCAFRDPPDKWIHPQNIHFKKAHSSFSRGPEIDFKLLHPKGIQLLLDYLNGGNHQIFTFKKLEPENVKQPCLKNGLNN